MHQQHEAIEEWVDYGAVCRLAGWWPSLRQLKRLRRAGALQPGRQTHVADTRGSVTLYPRAVGEQLRRIAELRREDRRLEEMVFELWWEERWVDRAGLRNALASLLDKAGIGLTRDVRRRHRQVDSPADGIYDRADEAVGKAPTVASRQPVVRHLRDHLPPEHGNDLDTVVYPLVLLLFGHDPVWTNRRDGDPDPNQLVRAATGYARAACDTYELDGQRLGPLVPPTDAIADAFQPLMDAGVLPISNLTAILAEASDAQLDQARDDIRRLIEPLARFARVSGEVLEPGAFGLGLFAALPMDAASRAVLTVLMVGVTNTWSADQRANADQLAAALAQTESQLQTLDTKIGEMP
jgi:hypothetical protein